MKKYINNITGLETNPYYNIWYERAPLKEKLKHLKAKIYYLVQKLDAYTIINPEKANLIKEEITLIKQELKKRNKEIK